MSCAIQILLPRLAKGQAGLSTARGEAGYFIRLKCYKSRKYRGLGGLLIMLSASEVAQGTPVVCMLALSAAQYMGFWENLLPYFPLSTLHYSEIPRYYSPLPPSVVKREEKEPLNNFLFGRSWGFSPFWCQALQALAAPKAQKNEMLRSITCLYKHPLAL